MKLKHDLYVINLTHWDREWRFPFQKTRMMLVEMMDELLDLMERKPAFKYFHLDGQTVLLEDYCEIRPQSRTRIRRLVKSGRLLIGPWYTLAEENQLAGESLVRNFLFGYKVGREFGGVMDCGYSPNSWGQVSQMPQILRGFGVRSAIFYRGITSHQVPGNFYLWRAPDGTDVFGVRLGNYARSAFFHLIYRPVVLDRRHGDSIHQWERGGKPLRLSGSGSITPYHFCDPPTGWHPENLEAAVADLEAREIGAGYELPFALAMHCNDSTGAMPSVVDIVNEMNRRARGPHRAKIASLTAFVDRAMATLDAAKLPVVVGEMRHHLRDGVWTDLYPEVQAARMPLKCQNRQSEYNLQRYAEPFATLAWRLGSEYPTPYLEKAWRMLLTNHAHDSFGGCGMDLVHEENAFRYKQVNILSENLLLKSLLAITSRVNTSAFAASDVVLFVFNCLPCPRAGVVEAEVDFDQKNGIKGLEVLDTGGRPLPFQVVERSTPLVLFQHPYELPCRVRADRWKIALRVEDIPALGYRVFKVRGLRRPSRRAAGRRGRIVRGRTTLENEYLRVKVNANGTFDLTRKAGGAAYRDLNLFQDRGEVGDPWVGAFPPNDRIITSRNCRAQIRVAENGSASGALEASIELRLPVKCSDDRQRRLPAARRVAMRSRIRLCRGEKFVRVSTTVDNTVEDHILRVLFPTNLKADTVQVETPFDVVTRVIKHPDDTGWKEPYRPVQPMRSIVDITDGRNGLAVLSAGPGQYEAVDSPRRDIALTLLRCFRQWNSVRLAEYPDQTGSQCLGMHTFDYAVYPHAGDWQAGRVALESALFNLPLKAAVGGPGKGDLPLAHGFLEIEDSRVELAALKKCEWDDSMVLRVFNPTGDTVNTGIRFGFPVSSAGLTDMKEKASIGTVPCRRNRIEVTVPTRRILTVRVRTQRPGGNSDSR